VCERLASMVRINTPATSDTMDIAMDDDNIPNSPKLVDLASPSPPSLSTASSTAVAASAVNSKSSVERLLASINDLLETRVRSDARLRHQTDRKQEMMSEWWMIAAAVIDRFCFIIFSIILVVSSLIFALLLFFHA